MPLKLTLLIGTFVAAFSLGGLTNLYLLYKTSVLRTMLIFLSSLILIMLNLFAFSFFTELPSIETLGLIIYLIGAGLNIWILPRLVSDLIIQPIPSAFKVIHILWTLTYILLCSLAFLAPGIPMLQPIILIMQVGSIGAALTIFDPEPRSHEKALVVPRGTELCDPVRGISAPPHPGYPHHLLAHPSLGRPGQPESAPVFDSSQRRNLRLLAKNTFPEKRFWWTANPARAV
jgi:hypothetical protein